MYPFTFPLLSITSIVAEVKQTFGKNSSRNVSSLTFIEAEFFEFLNFSYGIIIIFALITLARFTSFTKAAT